MFDKLIGLNWENPWKQPYGGIWCDYVADPGFYISVGLALFVGFTSYLVTRKIMQKKGIFNVKEN
jgi:hypothetical protein